MKTVAFLRSFALAKTAIFLVLSLIFPVSNAVWATEKLRSEATQAFERGDFARAALEWSEAARGFEVSGDARAQVLALSYAGAAHQNNGEAAAALSALQQARREMATEADLRSCKTIWTAF